MKKSTIILIHTGYWALYWFLFTFLHVLFSATTESAIDGWDDWAINLVLASLTGFISFYSFYFGLVPRYLTTQRVKRFIGLGLVVSLMIALLTTLLVWVLTAVIISVIFHTSELIFFELEDLYLLITGFTLLAVVNGLMATVIRGFITWYADIHVKETLINKNLQTELALLKAQINPHFLFNTLNNIDVLIEREPQTASRYLNKLSDLLRFVLYEAQSDQIPLTKELEYIRKYVELQKIRTTNEQYVTLQISGQAEGLTIAPMMLVSYIENAFKYATNKKVNDAIRIRIQIEDGKVHFHCVNVIDKSKTGLERQGGLGNELLNQRLALLYKDQYTLDIQATEDQYTVNLTLQLHVNELSYY